MFVFKKLGLILAGNIIANKDGSDIKGDGNLLSSSLNSPKLLYTLAESYLILKFLILLRSIDALHCWYSQIFDARSLFIYFC